MGCDIHMYTEVLKSVNSKNVWVNVDNYRPDPYEPGKFNHVDLHGHRNYALFTILAGVRDYSEATIPVSNPKGLPEDMSPEAKAAAESWDSDGHSHSYLSLFELKQYQATNPTITQTGLIDSEQRAELDRGILPESWCQGTNQAGYERRTW